MNETAIEGLRATALSLNIQRRYNAWGFEFIEKPALRGVDIAVKSGNKIFIWPDFDYPDELHYIDVGEFSWEEIWDKMYCDFASVPISRFGNIDYALHS